MRKLNYIIDLGRFQKDGPIAKAIVYFVVSKLNNIYEKLQKQAVSEECVEVRHFTIPFTIQNELSDAWGSLSEKKDDFLTRRKLFSGTLWAKYLEVCKI